jgi:hypothetical protein
MKAADGSICDDESSDSVAHLV